MDPRIIQAKLNALKHLSVVDNQPINMWCARTAHYLAPGQYEYLGDWHPVEVPCRWPALQTVFLSATAHVPEHWDPQQTFLVFDFRDMEGLVSIGNRPWAGLDFGHTRAPVPGLGQHALHLEFLSVPRASSEPGLRNAEGLFRGASMQQVDLEIEAAYYDFRFAFETMNAISDERRRNLLSAAIEDAMVAFTLTASKEQVRDEILSAKQLLASRIAEIAPDPEGGRLFLTGHTHIDVAYLWPIKETIRKCSRTFATACRLMERFPHYHFACSQAQLYAYTKEHYPALYDEIKHWVAAERWETTGAMWVEADANVTSGESLIRQILYGLAFFREEFGTRATVCWLPDVFGYNAGMPQILVGCGLRSFWTWKLHWQSRNPFPYHLFWWEGIDGSRILAHIPKLGGGGYNGAPNPEQLARAWETYQQKSQYDEQLFPFGYGNGGGGVNEEMMEFANRAAHYPGIPACRQGTVEQFFADVHKASPDLPTWVGELYLETHRGTYTTQGHTKRGNRLCELALREAEIWGTLALGRASREKWLQFAHTLRAEWETVLLHQFHDILPGSSIRETYSETASDHTRVHATALKLRNDALSKLTKPCKDRTRFRLFNSLSWDRDDIVPVAIPNLGDSVVARVEGVDLPAQITARSPDSAEVVFIAPRVPSVGAVTAEVRAGNAPKTDLLHMDGSRVENEFYIIEIGDDGTLIRLFDKRAEREVLPDGERANILQLFQDGPEREAAWNIHPNYVKREYRWDNRCSVESIEQGPVRSVTRVQRQYQNSSLTQDIIIYSSLPRIDFKTHVEWHERQTLLKVAFPLAIRASHATFEVQFGALERPNHRNTPWDQEKFEVCGQRWADLSEGGYGVSLLNDCKYGHDVLGNVLRLTLLRGTEYPDTDADQGSHDFTYSLLPHLGDWRQGKTVCHAAQLNAPLAAIPTGEIEPSASYVRVTGPAILETLKPAEDGNGAIVRLYEPHGARGRVTVEHQLPCSQMFACNLVEEDANPVVAESERFTFDIQPFQIRTFRLVPESC